MTRRRVLLTIVGIALATASACGSGRSTSARSAPAALPRPTTSAPSTTIAPAATRTPTPSAHTSATTSAASRTRTKRPAPTRTRPIATRTAAPPPVRSNAPLIVIDPGHSVPVHGTDARTGLDVSDYENEPEMRDVFTVAVLVRKALVRDGYRVVMTKATADTPATLGKRAHIANRLHAALALSIHDQAGANGGIGFDQGNNIVYYQSVGDYRETPSGKKVYFTDSRVAAISKRYAEVFQRQRAAAQATSIALRGDTGYDLGARGLQAGDMWIVQLLSKVPWIYNEAGGNSAGMVGLSQADERRYAKGLIAAVEACVPVARR